MIADTWCPGIEFTPGGRIWVFPEQQVLLTEARMERPTPSDANALIDVFLWLRRTLDESAQPVVIHDWRAMRSIPRETRQVFLARRGDVRGQPERIIVATDVNPLVRMVIRTAALAAQLVSGTAPIELVKDLHVTLAEHGVRTPDPAVHERLRSWFAEHSQATRR